MRILMLTEFYPPIIGGEEQHVRNLGMELVKRGHDVAIATIAHDKAPNYEVDNGVRVYRVRSSTQRLEWLYTTSLRHAPPLPDPELVMGLRRVVKRERPQIVHAHNWLVYSFLPLKQWSGAKLVLSLHDHSLVCVQKRFMYREVSVCDGPGLRKCLTCARVHYGQVKGPIIVGGSRLSGVAERRVVDMFLPVSQAVATGNHLREAHLPFRVIPNFVPDDVAALREMSGADAYQRQLPGDGYLLYVGDLTQDKGVEVLLRAYKQLGDSPNVPPLALIGAEAPDSASLMRDLPRGVVVLKRWPHDAVMQAWRHSMIALVPSLCPDACPTVVMEAMAMGRPVIGSRIGGITDLVADDETGILTPPGEVTPLAHALERLLSDSALRERMGQAARQRVIQFQATTVVRRIERVYEAVSAI